MTNRSSIIEKCLRNDSEKVMHFRIVTTNDAKFLIKLRCDSSLNQYISKTSEKIEDQIIWLQEYKIRETSGLEFYFIIVYQGCDVGCVRIYDIQDDSFCWGSWIIKKGTPAHISYRSAMQVYEYAFQQLHFKKSHFSVEKENRAVCQFHLRMGATIVEENEHANFFNYSHHDYSIAKQKLARFLNL